MAFQIPAELIQTIIDYNHNDTQTLKTCATVSHFFLHHCRRHLFSDISLHSSKLSLNLYSLVLSSKPEIALNVRELVIDGGPIRNRGNWPDNDEHLPKILSFVDRLQKLTLIQHFHPIVWDSLPKALLSALIERIQSPSLTILHLRGWVGLPKSLVMNLNQLRELSIDPSHLIDDSNHLSSALGLEGLEILELQYINLVAAPTTPLDIFLYMERLLLLHIEAFDTYTLSFAQQVIHRYAGSLRSILLDGWWDDSEVWSPSSSS